MKIYILSILLLFSLVSRSQSFEENYLANPDLESKLGIVSGLILQNEEADSIMAQDVLGRIDAFLKPYRNKKFLSKPKKKQVDVLFKATHKEFFKKYEEIASFDEIFETGTFNCVSGSALYALLLKELSIEYSVISQPGHVYLIADPQEFKIPIECTDPLTGTSSRVSDKAKRQYIQQLRSYKMIGADEFPGMTDEAIYDQMMYEETKEVPIEALIAYQYYNKGLDLMSNKKNDKSLEKLEKAYDLYQDETFKGSIIFNYLIMIQQSVSSPLQATKYFLKMIEYRDSSLTSVENEEIVNVARASFEEYFINRDYPDSSEQILYMYQQTSLDSALQLEILEGFLKSKQDWSRYKEDDVTNLLCIYSLAKLRPRDLRIQSNYKWAKRSLFDLNLDSLEVELELGQQKGYYHEEIEIKVEEVRAIQKLSKKMETLDMSYVDDLDDFEVKFPHDQHDFTVYGDELELIYLDAWSYHVRNNRNTKAYKIANRGLQYFPESIELKKNYQTSKEVARRGR